MTRDTTQPGADNALDLKKLNVIEAAARAVDSLPDTIQPFVSIGGQVVISTFTLAGEQLNAVARFYDAADPKTVLALIALARRAAQPVELADMEARKDAAYYERNQVVAALAKCFPSGVARTAIEGWSEDWHGCVYIDLPTGQASWHFHDSQAHLFDGLPPYAGTWDGHDTPEKYRRLAALATHPAEPAVPAVGGALVAMREALQDIRDEASRGNYDNLYSMAVDALGAPAGALIAITDEQQDHVTPPMRGTGSQHDAGASVLTEAQIIQALGTITHEVPNRLPPGWLKFARAIETELASRCGAQGRVTQANSAESSSAGSAAAPAEQTQAARDVLAERRRQVESEGWHPDQDDDYEDGQLSMAAACYAMQGNTPNYGPPNDWPWDKAWWKPTDDRRNLVKAGALIVAEIERLDRATPIPTKGNGDTDKGEQA